MTRWGNIAEEARSSRSHAISLTLARRDASCTSSVARFARGRSRARAVPCGREHRQGASAERLAFKELDDGAAGMMGDEMMGDEMMGLG